MVVRKRKSRKKKSSGAAAILLAILLVALLTGAAAVWLVFVPFGPQSETFVEIPPGSTTSQIGRQLENSGIVRSRYAFDLVRIWKRGTLKAGEYRFDQPVLLADVYQRIARGDVYTKTVVIPEGACIFDIAERLEQAGLGTRKDFLVAAVGQVGLVADLDPRATSLEGYLFPDTYRFPRKATAAQIAATMVRRFRTVAGQIGLKENLHQVVTMASVIERETAVDAERPLVASVFVNRLARGMPIMSDPTLIYGLEIQGRWRGVIHQSDLADNTPFNTYLHAGLPPSPISNPGIKSLKAAISPAKTDYLYFVARGDDPQGGSVFATTLEEHNHNVAGYRHAMKKAGGR
jgi:UPF0755 protein